MTAADNPETGWRAWRAKVFAVIPFVVLALGLTVGQEEEPPQPKQLLRQQPAWEGFRWIQNSTASMRTNANTCRVQYFAHHKGKMLPVDPADLIEIDESIRNRHMIAMEMRRMCAAVAPKVDLRAEITCNASMTGKQISKRGQWMCQKRRFPRTGSWRPGRG
jgi:hypothetical protein